MHHIIYYKSRHISKLCTISVLRRIEALLLKLEFSEKIRSILWLLMPCLLVSLGHQQPWYCLWRINMCMRNYFIYLICLRFEKCPKMQLYLCSKNWFKITRVNMLSFLPIMNSSSAVKPPYLSAHPPWNEAVDKIKNLNLNWIWSWGRDECGTLLLLWFMLMFMYKSG